MKAESDWKLVSKQNFSGLCAATLIVVSALWYCCIRAPSKKADKRYSCGQVPDESCISSPPQDHLSPEQAEIACNEAEKDRIAGNGLFQRGNYNEALELYVMGMKKLNDQTSMKCIKQRNLLKSNLLLCLYKIGSFVEVCDFATACLEDPSLDDSLKVKILYRRALSSAAIGEKRAAIMDLKAAIFFSPNQKNAEAERELKRLQG